MKTTAVIATGPGGGFASVLMDEASLDTSRVEYFVTDKELLTLGEHEAVYLNTQSIRRASYSQYIYISYPEYQRILIIYGTNNITKEALLELARSTSLTPTGEEVQLVPLAFAVAY